MAYVTQFADEAETIRLRWNTRQIPISFSNSLLKQNASVRPDSDVAGAIQRSLAVWEKAAEIKFQVTWTDKQTISAAGKVGDGISLVTIAPTAENLLLFGAEAEPISAQTRVFFNRKGFITEADIALNPYEQFSTDGSFGTFDLEATLTHEIGHLLGLEHSPVMSATMHEHQGKNGVYNLPSFGARTLAEDDLAGIRALYGTKSGEENCCGTISGKLVQTNGKPAKDFLVWAEESESGRLIAGVLSGSDGSFRIEGLRVAQYKLYTQDFAKKSDKSYSAQELEEVEVVKGKTQIVSKKIKLEPRGFDVRYIGFNGQVSELAVPVNGGKSYLIYIGGKNLDADKMFIGFSSPYISVAPNSLTNQNYGAELSVISFEINVEAETPLGEYSFFIKNKNAETEFAVGSLTVESFVNPWNNFARLDD